MLHLTNGSGGGGDSEEASGNADSVVSVTQNSDGSSVVVADAGDADDVRFRLKSLKIAV